MNAYQRYIKLKALSEFWEGLSDDDKKLIVQSLSENEKYKETNVSTDKKVDCRDPYFRGVSQNIVGDALYDIGIHLLKRLIPR